MKNTYKISLFNEELDGLSFSNKKIFTYVKNSNFYGEGGMFDVWLESKQYKRMGLKPLICSMVGSVGCRDSYSSSCDPFKDSLEEMSKRIIIW